MWPIALHDVDIAFKKHFVAAFMLSLLLFLICSKFSVESVDNFSPSGMPSILDLHVITPLEMVVAVVRAVARSVVVAVVRAVAGAERGVQQSIKGWQGLQLQQWQPWQR